MTLQKSDARRVRDAIASTYPADTKVYRSGLNCYGLVEEAYFCFNVQNSKYAPDRGLEFCVNWGVVPDKIHRANPERTFAKKPSYLDAILYGVTRGRLTPSPSAGGDQWFTPKTQNDLDQIADELRRYTERLWDTKLIAMAEDAWHIKALTKKHGARFKRFLDILEHT